MLVDKTKFGSVLYNHANFYRFDQLHDDQFFSAFHWSSAITVYNRTVTNIENNMRAVHSCNSCKSRHRLRRDTVFKESKIGSYENLPVSPL